MAVYAIADLHLSLANDKPMDIFGNRWQGFFGKLEKNWRSLVTDEDTVVIPGDISWGMDLSEASEDLAFIASLPGRKIISKGNHDYWWNTANKITEFFKSCGIDNIELLHNNAKYADGKIICGTRGWFNDQKVSPRDADYKKIVLREAGRCERSILEGIKLREELGGEIILFLHFPPIFNDYRCDEILEVIKRYDISRCYFGHIHGVYDIPASIRYEGCNFTMISSDFLNFIPLLIR